jgi:hypothetical protein
VEPARGALASDYKEVKNVFMYTVSQAVLTSREKPVRTLADLKGVKVFTPGAAFAPIVGAWGASPVPMDLNDMFNAMSTGVVDMVALPATSLLPPFRLAEIAKSTSFGISGLYNPCGSIMNKESYAALTPSQKAAFDRLTGKELSLKGAKIFDDWSRRRSRRHARANGWRSSRSPPTCAKPCSTPRNPSPGRSSAISKTAVLPMHGRSIKR